VDLQHTYQAFSLVGWKRSDWEEFHAWYTAAGYLATWFTPGDDDILPQGSYVAIQPGLGIASYAAFVTTYSTYSYRKGNTMNTNDLDDAKLKAQILKTKKALADLEQALEERRLPPEPSEGTVIKFQVEFKRYGTRYYYAALNVHGSWYTTATQKAMVHPSWKALLNWIRDETEWHSPIYVQTGAKELEF
jgi:hypothetical protein